MFDTDDMILPTPEPFFEWRSTPFGPALVCRPLATLAAHLFTTRPWQLGSPQTTLEDAASWTEMATAMGVADDRLVRLRQVHGAECVVAAPGTLPAADAVIGTDPDIAMAVQAADCVPLLLVDARTGATAAVHAGWRGMAAGAPRRAVHALADRYGSRASDLYAAAGPSIGACCYEVGGDVRQAFAEGGWLDTMARWFLRDRPNDPRNRAFRSLPDTARDGHWYFDGWTCVSDQLLASGLCAEQIFSPRLCTASHPDLLCSYRRDGAPAGRIAAVVRPPRR